MVPTVHHPPGVVDQEGAMGDFLPEARLCRIVFLQEPGAVTVKMTGMANCLTSVEMRAQSKMDLSKT